MIEPRERFVKALSEALSNGNYSDFRRDFLKKQNEDPEMFECDDCFEEDKQVLSTKLKESAIYNEWRESLQNLNTVIKKPCPTNKCMYNCSNAILDESETFAIFRESVQSFLSGN